MSEKPSNRQNSGLTRATRSRFKPQALAGMRLEARDEALLCDLFLHRLMSREQIQAAYFTSVVRCNARLRQLFDYHFVTRHYPPFAPFGAQAIYALGKAALPVVARRLEMELPDVARYYRRTQTPTFIEHTLAIVDLWLAFRDAVATHPGVEMDRWLAEMQCRHEWEIRVAGSRAGRKEAFKPDAFVRLYQGGHELNLFLEVDLGHTSSRQFGGKLLTHQRYLDSKLFEQTYASRAFRTGVVTTGDRRLRNLLALTQEHGSDLFWFTTFGEVKSQGVLGPIWSSFRRETPTTIFSQP